MNTPRIAKAMAYIDDDLIDGAVSYQKEKKRARHTRWRALAACLAILSIVGAAILPSLLGGETEQPAETDGRYKNFTVQKTEYGIVWPWQYKTVYEKYRSIELDGREFICRGREISASHIGERIGTYEATGYDDFSDTVYHETFETYRIKSVISNALIAVRMENRYYVFISEKCDPPATLGELLAGYALSETVTLGRFSFVGKNAENSYYLLDSDDFVWTLLEACAEAKAANPIGWHATERGYISFTVTSEALGVYKHALYITDDGYIWTNAFNGEFLYFIGTDAAESIIEYAKEHSAKTEYEPLYPSIVGTVVEIAEEYVLIDDSVLCKDPADGMIFKIMLHDGRISRYVDIGEVVVGETVVVSYEGEIDKRNGNVIASAVSISRAIITDGDVWIPE